MNAANIICGQCGGNMAVAHGFDAFCAALSPTDAIRQNMLAFMRTRPDAAFDSILRCERCGVMQLQPMPSHEVLSAFYNSYAGNDGYAKKLDSKLRRAGKRIAALKRRLAGEGLTFLDVGCNIGAAVEAARLQGFAATGIEIGEEAVVRAKQLFPENTFHASTAQAFAATGAQFDLVYCTEVIEHVTDTASFTRALAALVKPGGLLFLTTPDAGHWRRPKNFLAWAEVKPPEHVNWQTRRSMRQLLTRHGFEKPAFRFALKPGMRLMAHRAA